MQKTDNQWTNVYEQLAEDEGIVLEIYNDHLGYATFGIGHLITEDDPEYGQEVGTPVSAERVRECFDNDILIFGIIVILSSFILSNAILVDLRIDLPIYE